MFLTADKFEDMEVFFRLFRLLEMGLHVDIEAPTRKEIILLGWPGSSMTSK